MKINFTVLIFVTVAAYADAKKRCFPVPTPVVDPPPPQPVCAKNEVYSECGANGCQNTCENPTLGQVCRAVCMAGCICKEGYLRDSKGKCVLAKNCPQKCKKFEIFSDCAPEACKKTCDTLNTACRAPCVPGCKCPENHVYRDDKRDACILKKECPIIIVDPPPPAQCSKKHESFTDCGTACPLTCENVNNPPMACTMNCVVGCFCDTGYVRNSKGDCVLVEDCPAVVPVCKKANESYNKCGTACPLTCEEPLPRPCTKQCVKGCFCDKGYLRDKKGNCVKVEDCPKPKCGNNENYNECGASPCQATCKEPNLPKMCKAPCKPGCGCNDGYVRDDDGDCILLKKCPPALECGDNEVYEACTHLCGEPTCKRSEPLYCGLGECQPKCLCKKGYVRTPEGDCIPKEKCPAFECKKEHEIYTTCGTACPLTCKNRIPDICTKQCVAGCFCDKGYVRGSQGDCVLPDKCPIMIVDVRPPTKCEKEHENYTTCGSACPLTCENPTPGPCTKNCVRGCFCVEGYVRDYKGNCIRAKDCPKSKCGKNKNYNKCGDNPCEATCNSPSLPFRCHGPCKPGCGCNDGYFRDKEGNCVLLKNCPPKLTCEDNEDYEICTTLCEEPSCDKKEASYCGYECKPRCVCKKGYVRNAEKKCIKSKDCQASQPGSGNGSSGSS